MHLLVRKYQVLSLEDLTGNATRQFERISALPMTYFMRQDKHDCICSVFQKALVKENVGLSQTAMATSHSILVCDQRRTFANIRPKIARSLD